MVTLVGDGNLVPFRLAREGFDVFKEVFGCAFVASLDGAGESRSADPTEHFSAWGV